MRIISGKYKGRRIKAPKKLPVRPTTDMAKEALFNILSHQYNFDQINFLDLFAGTGNMSYEFCSRGTNNINSVDNNRNCCKFIRETAKELAMPIQIIFSDAFKFLDKTTKTFDVIFADPPYDIDQNKLELIIETVFKNKLINNYGTCIIEHSKHKSLKELENFKYLKKYGGNCFSFFK